MTLAPIILFTYSRPEHTRRTVESLLKNQLASESDLIIYSDAARTIDKQNAVRDVRDYLSTVQGFRSVTIKYNEINYGLAKSIILGVTETIEKYGHVIVLEDDIETYPGFLMFMNEALHKYANESKVWHISGWNYPIDHEGLADIFFWRLMNCWGWATWSDRWKSFNKNPQRLVDTWKKDKIYRFDLDGVAGMWGQVQANHLGTLNTWAVFWYATIFENNGLCVNPSLTLVTNIGHDGSGENCGNEDIYSKYLSIEKIIEYPIQIEESMLALARIKEFYKRHRTSFIERIVRRVRRIINNKININV